MKEKGRLRRGAEKHLSATPLLGRRVVVSATVVDHAASLTETAEPARRPWTPFLAALAKGEHVPVGNVRREESDDTGHHASGVATEGLAVEHGERSVRKRLLTVITFCLFVILSLLLLLWLRLWCGE